MTQKQITHLQNIIDDFMSIAVYDWTIDSEGYPHGSYNFITIRISKWAHTKIMQTM